MSYPTVTCQAMNANFVRETGRIALSTARLGLFKDPYLRFVSQSAFPDNMGAIIKNTVSQRTLASGTGWSDDNGIVGVSNSASGSENDACKVPVKKVQYGYDDFSFQLRHQAIESEYICLEDVRTSAFPVEDVNSYIKILADNVNKEWIDRYDDDYLENAGHHVSTVVTGLEDRTDATSFVGSTLPTSPLTVGVLREIYDRLYMDNAGDDGDAITDDGSPVFNVFSDRRTIENLVKLQGDVRDDIRWSDRVNDLLGPNGSAMLPNKSYGGFVFSSRPFPKRYAADGVTEVPPYIAANAGGGSLGEITQKAIVNPAYLIAPYSTTVIFHPKAMEWLVPSTNVKVGKLTYSSQNYRGDFRWVNEFERTCNPDRTSGFWRAKMSCAVKKVYPQWAYYIIHQNCSLANDMVDCTA